MQSISPSVSLKVAARGSPLSVAQVEELQSLIHPFVAFEKVFVDTYGDKDRTTSLRTLGKTDFFTREVDALVLSGKCDVSVHSAKDLPEVIPENLSLIAVTRGVDSRDVLVLREGESLESLPEGAVIATSSERRIDAVKALREGFRYIDLRGTIGERLQLLQEGVADGVVVAEAALIRLKLTHLNRVYLPGTTVEGQGRLAIVGKSDKKYYLEKLFSCLDREKQFEFFI
jgi:hydroxymethylbilane synthase